jgi:hypothetical protein
MQFLYMLTDSHATSRSVLQAESYHKAELVLRWPNNDKVGMNERYQYVRKLYLDFTQSTVPEGNFFGFPTMIGTNSVLA